MDSATVATITSAVDFSTVIIGIGAISVAISALVVAYRGTSWLIDQLRDAHLYRTQGRWWDDDDQDAAFGKNRWFM